jgi:hypothetical protein
VVQPDQDVARHDGADLEHDLGAVQGRVGLVRRALKHRLRRVGRVDDLHHRRELRRGLIIQKKKIKKIKQL